MTQNLHHAATPRKVPKQARSTQLVADILVAAIRVLEREGASRFTTIRVAETAGVSVGSLYQYFPNKQAILFRLQVDEWQRTGSTMGALLGDPATPPEERLGAMIHQFFQSEAALHAAAPSCVEVPESRAGRELSKAIVQSFIVETAPLASPRQRRFAGELLFTTITAVGKQLAQQHPDAAEVARWSDEITQMLIGYLSKLQ